MIALDIDGIVCPFASGVWVPAMNKTLHKNIEIVGEGDTNTLDFSTRFNLTKKEVGYVWGSRHLLDYMRSVRPIPRGFTIVRGLENRKEDYCFITSRGSHNDSERSLLIRDITIKWVKEELYSNAPVYFERKLEKQVKAVELGVTTMWEDHPETMVLLADNNIDVFSPLYGYNEHVKHDRIILIEDWV
jgi:hypothetical protein